MLTEILSLRKKTSFDIQYIIVGKRYDSISFLPPQEFDNSFLRTISYLPQNIFQFDHPIRYILLQWQTMSNSGYDISFAYEDYSIEELLRFHNRQITVLFIDKNIKDKNRIISTFKNGGFFFFLYDKECKDEYCFSNPIHLINKIITSKAEIQAHFAKYGLNITFSFKDEIPDIFKSENKYDYFLPSLSNFFMLNQYIGNLYFDEDYKNEIEKTLTGPKFEDDYKEYFGRTNRIEIIMKQILNIDKFRIIAEPELPFLKKGDVNPQHTPLILVSPYQYPQLDSIMPGIENQPGFKLYKEAFKGEQDIDYRNQLNVSKGEKEDIIKLMSASAHIGQRRMGYLDEVAYLHASYTFSPILRLPLQGRSLNKFMSFFNPAASIPSASKLYSTIKTFGNEYRKRVLSEHNAKKIFGRNRQIVAISDLPVEWMHIDNTPLSITHDVTRIPELPFGGIMSFYVRNKAIQYSIPTNILEKTLVVFGVNGDRRFDVGYEFIKTNSEALGYKTIQCDSIPTLKKEIDSFKPHLIVFDTHGNVNSEEKSSHIQIGNDILTGEDIVKYGLAAPLIVLSACNTVPNWGYFNNIANAFFEAGALSITGTFLPIGIFSGTLFYNRILVNLNLAQTEAIHSNWLNFMSHNIRTNYISETMLAVHKVVSIANVSQGVKNEIDKKITMVAGDQIRRAMSFSRRKSVYQNIEQTMQNIHPILRNKKFLIPFEQLLYTNLGRGDLIMFSSWLKENAGIQIDDLPSE